VTILTERALDFATLTPAPPEFQLAGDAERVALTCAAIGVDATDLDLPVPLDRRAYIEAIERLTARGLIEGGRLTAYGREVEALPVDRPWAELLVHADTDLVPIVAGASGIDSLHRMTREERDLHGVLVNGSDHLTAYNLLAEAVNSCGRMGEVHGLDRHVFDEEELAAWAERRGVLVKAIEDGALGLASVYRSLDLALPPVLPRVTRELRERFVALVAEIQPFTLVLDERTVDGHDARVSKTSVAGNWGAVAGSLRWFADRFGTARASIEGTTIPLEMVQRFAAHGPPMVVLAGHGTRQGLAVARRLQYAGFDLETTMERIPGEVPEPLRPSARETLADALLAGGVEHPSRGPLARAILRLDEYWRRSGGALPGVDPEARRDLILAQLGDVTSWEDFQATPVHLDVEALVPTTERAHLEALPGGLRLHGDMAPLEYAVEQGVPVVRLLLREGQARRLRAADLPPLDRALRLVVRRGGESLEAATVEALHGLLDRPRARTDRPGTGGRDRGGRPSGGGRDGPRGGGPKGNRGGPRRGGPGGARGGGGRRGGRR
jgi:hypothetical protein